MPRTLAHSHPLKVWPEEDKRTAVHRHSSRPLTWQKGILSQIKSLAKTSVHKSVGGTTWSPSVEAQLLPGHCRCLPQWSTIHLLQTAWARQFVKMNNHVWTINSEFVLIPIPDLLYKLQCSLPPFCRHPFPLHLICWSQTVLFPLVSLLYLSLCKSKKEVFFNIAINLRMWGRGTSRSLTTDSSTGLVK